MQKRDLYYERIPTKLLRDDVRYLGNILGKVIKEQEGKNFFNLVEKIRRLSKANKTRLNTKQTNRKVIKAIQDLEKAGFNLGKVFYRQNEDLIPYTVLDQSIPAETV